MKSEQLRAMAVRFGEDVCFCRWCDTWKPRSKMYKYGEPHFLKLSTCSSCYSNFDKIMKDAETQMRMFKVLVRRMKITVRIITEESEETKSPVPPVCQN